MEYKIRCTLLSDTLPGSGEGISGSVDLDVHYDDEGIPYIPAKRLKGILRENAEALQSILLKHSVDELFGRMGEDSLSPFKLGNGKIQNYTRYSNTLKILKKQGIPVSREEVLSYFTYERTSTTVDEDSGTAKSGTLRTMRVLRKGLIFEFPLKILPEFIEDFKLICKASTHMGVSRSRGLGHIQLELKKADKTKKVLTLPDNIPDQENVQLSIRIRNMEPLLVTSEVGKNQKTMNFIPGSMLRGALSYLYIQKHAIDKPHRDQNFRNLFLEGNLTFLPGYPVIDGQRSLPAPACIVKQKDENKYYNLLSGKDLDQIIRNQIQTKGGLKDFFVVRNDRIFHKNVDTFIDYHHQRPKNKELGSPVEGDGEFFQFEVLAESQEFEFVLAGDKNFIQIVADMLKENPFIYLGKSKSAQYGLCEVVTMEWKNTVQTSVLLKPGEKISIFLESDVIVRNQYGYPEPSLEAWEYFLKKHFPGLENLKVLPDESFLKFRYWGGFKGVWRLEKPHVQAIAAGSVVTVKNDGQNTLNLSSLFENMFGYYTEDGFGKLTHFSFKGKSLQGAKVFIPENETDEESEKIGDEDQNFLKYMYMQKAMKMVRELGMFKVQDMRKNKMLLQASNSLLSYFLKLVNEAQSFEHMEEFLKKLRTTKFEAITKIASSLFLKGDGKTLSYSINKMEFRDTLKNANVYDELLRNEEHLFSFYKEYVSTLLTTARIKKRGV